MQLNIQVDSSRAQRLVTSVPRQARFAAAQALNGAAFQSRLDWQAQIRAVFDRPTPFIEQSIWVGKRATREDLHAEVGPRYYGGKSVDPEKVLLAEAFGGVRRPKRFEVALRRAGVLPQNMAAVPARWVTTDPATADGYGGVKGSFIVRLLSYLQAFGEVGYRANMTLANRKKLSGQGRWANGRFYGAHTKVGASGAGVAAFRQGGVAFFVSKGRGSSVVTRRQAAAGRFGDGHDQHLPAGIWQRSGAGGFDVKPVFLFTRMPRYRVRMDLVALADRARNEHFPPLFDAAFRRAMETAR
jgi:hypothetical protein